MPQRVIAHLGRAFVILGITGGAWADPIRPKPPAPVVGVQTPTLGTALAPLLAQTGEGPRARYTLIGPGTTGFDSRLGVLGMALQAISRVGLDVPTRATDLSPRGLAAVAATLEESSLRVVQRTLLQETQSLLDTYHRLGLPRSFRPLIEGVPASAPSQPPDAAGAVVPLPPASLAGLLTFALGGLAVWARRRSRG